MDLLDVLKQIVRQLELGGVDIGLSCSMVVAPMIVNFLSGRLMVLADIPSPRTTSTRKSSITG